MIGKSSNNSESTKKGTNSYSLTNNSGNARVEGKKKDLSSVAWCEARVVVPVLDRKVKYGLRAFDFKMDLQPRENRTGTAIGYSFKLWNRTWMFASGRVANITPP